MYILGYNISWRPPRPSIPKSGGTRPPTPWYWCLCSGYWC